MTLGYAVLRPPTTRRDSVFLAAVSSSEDGECTESTWSLQPRDALLLPTARAAMSLAWAICAGRRAIVVRAISTPQKRAPMKKSDIRKMAASYADDPAALSGDPSAAREAWIDVGGNNAGWKRRGFKPEKATARKGVRKAGAR